ncbi:MAG: hypothetical protein JO041_10720 [Acidobacteria bacterium]|nr:hypothetical protein [Acidobacteriota bacterium]
MAVYPTSIEPPDRGSAIAERRSFWLAFLLALTADALQLVLFPLLSEGALSPFDDALDFAVAGLLVFLLGWHWEFLPSCLGKLLPMVDAVPFWTLAVGNVYRKWRRIHRAAGPSTLEGRPTTG